MLLLGYIFVFGIWVNESTHGDVYMIHNLKREQGQFTQRGFISGMFSLWYYFLV